LALEIGCPHEGQEVAVRGWIRMLRRKPIVDGVANPVDGCCQPARIFQRSYPELLIFAFPHPLADDGDILLSNCVPFPIFVPRAW